MTEPPVLAVGLMAGTSLDGIDAALLAAIALKESDFINKAEVDGVNRGVGIFQITVSTKSGVTAEQASDSAWAADWPQSISVRIWL